MEIWFILAVVSSIFIGINEFIKKIVAKKGFNKNQFLIYSAIAQLIVSFLYYLYIGSIFYMSFLFGLLIIIRIILVIEKNSLKIESLKYIDTSLFFPAHKLLKIGGGFFVGMFLFGEYLNKTEIIFFIIGVISVLLLGYKKNKSDNKELKKGVTLLLISSFFLILTSTVNKYISVNHSIELYLFLSNILGITYLGLKINLQKNKYYFNKKELFYGFISGVLGFIGFLSLMYALKEGKLVVVQLISTISVFIPIIGAFIVFKEEINKIRLLGLIIFLFNLGFLYINI